MHFRDISKARRGNVVYCCVQSAVCVFFLISMTDHCIYNVIAK